MARISIARGHWRFALVFYRITFLAALKETGCPADQYGVSRYSTHDPQSATIKFSSKGISQSIPCLYGEMQGKRLLLETEQTLPISQAVTVEYNDALFLGEVIFCANINQSWKVEIKVEQVLSGLQSLIALRSRLLCENVSPSSRMIPVGGGSFSECKLSYTRQ